MEEKQKEQDLLDRYLSQESKVLNKSYLDTQTESGYLDVSSKPESERLSYLDKLNDPESQQDKSYLEAIRFDYLDQDTTIKDVKIDYGYFEKVKPDKPEQKPEPPVAKEPEPEVMAEQQAPTEIEKKQEQPVVEPEKVIDHRPQLPKTVWYLTEGSQEVNSGIKSFSPWQNQPFRGGGKLKKVWSTEVKTDLNQTWPISTTNTWFVGPYMKINPITGEVRMLKKPLVPEMTDGTRIFGAMKLDDDWWRVAIDLETANFTGKFMPAAKPRGNFKAVNKCLLYLDARERSNPTLCRLNPVDCSVVWKIASNGAYKVSNAGVASNSLWIFQKDIGSIFTSVDPVRGFAIDYQIDGVNPADCFDFWGKFFLTTSNGRLFEYDFARKMVVRDIPLGLDGWTTTFMHAFENRVYLKSTNGSQTKHFSVDPLAGEFVEISGFVPRKDGCRYYQDGRNLRKLDAADETVWFIDDYSITGVIMEDEQGVLVKSGSMLSLWS